MRSNFGSNGSNHGMSSYGAPSQQRAGSFSSSASASQPSTPTYSTQYASPASGGYGAASTGGYSTNGYSNGGGSHASNGYSSNGYSSKKGYGNDDKYAKKSKGGKSLFSMGSGSGAGGKAGGMGMVLGCIGLFCYAVLMTTLYWSKSSATSSMLSRLDQPDTLSVIQKIEDLERRLKTSESTRQRAEHNARSKFSNELNTLERSNRLLKDQVDQHTTVHLPEAKAKVDNFTKREKAWKSQVDWLISSSMREAKRNILERFGPGPHKVEITFMIPLKEGPPDGTEKRHKFVIDLAPVDLVPHAIHLFLEQVDHGLMDGTQFYLNGPHIVQAGPQPTWENAIDGSDDAFDQYSTDAHDNRHKLSTNAVGTLGKYAKIVAEQNEYDDDDDDEYEHYYNEQDYKQEDKRTKKFADLGLDQLAYPDYHDEYPHVAWTVGYTGRPGGPDWYINKVDNTKAHGPGGQKQHVLPEQGDSCFGTISSEGTGRNALATYLYNTAVYNDNSEWHHFMTHPVEIVHAEILTKEPILDRHLHLTHLTGQHKVYNHRKKRRHVDESTLPEATIEHGDGVDPDKIPEHIHAMMKKKGATYTIKKVPHHGHRPHIDHAAEA